MMLYNVLAVLGFLLGILNFLLFLAARKAIVEVLEEIERQKKMVILGREEGAEKSLEKAVKELKELLYSGLGIKRGATTSELIAKIEESKLSKDLKKSLVLFFTKLIEFEYSPEKSKKDLLWLRNEAIKLSRLLEEELA